MEFLYQNSIKSRASRKLCYHTWEEAREGVRNNKFEANIEKKNIADTAKRKAHMILKLKQRKLIDQQCALRNSWETLIGAMRRVKCAYHSMIGPYVHCTLQLHMHRCVIS